MSMKVIEKKSVKRMDLKLNELNVEVAEFVGGIDTATCILSNG